MERESRRTLAKQRVAQGLCPQCGKEAAPYRLCVRCRLGGVVGRCLKAGVRAGRLQAVRDPKDGRAKLYKLTGDGPAKGNWRFASPYDITMNLVNSKGDGRTRPRLARVAVDVEEEIVGIFQALGRPATVDEIISAWGRLRESRRHATAAGDVAAIIAADRRRAARAEKRLRHGQQA